VVFLKEMFGKILIVRPFNWYFWLFVLVRNIPFTR